MDGTIKKGNNAERRELRGTKATLREEYNNKGRMDKERTEQMQNE